MLLHYLGKLKNQIYCVYSPCMEGNGNKLHFQCTGFKFSTRVTVYSKCVFIKILFLSLNTMLIVDKHCCNVCCDKFMVSQIDCKTKQVKEQWHCRFYLQSVFWEKLAILNTENVEICGWIAKVEAIKMQFVYMFFHRCWISVENLHYYFPKVV